MVFVIRTSLVVDAYRRLAKLFKHSPYATAYEWHRRFRWLPLVLYSEETRDYAVVWLSHVMRKRVAAKPGMPHQMWWYQMPGDCRFKAQRICVSSPEP